MARRGGEDSLGPAETIAGSSNGRVEAGAWEGAAEEWFGYSTDSVYHQLSPPQLCSGQLSMCEGAAQLLDTDGHDGCQLCLGHGSALE
jgi:hypothetical protein